MAPAFGYNRSSNADLGGPELPEHTVYLNDKLVPADEARLSVFDYGLLYGLAVFETLRTYDGKVFRQDAHLDRLYRGAEALKISGPDRSRVAEAVALTLKASGVTEGRVRITLTAGEGTSGPLQAPETPPNLLITVSPFTQSSDDDFEHGQSAIISSVRRSSLSPVPRHKTSNLLENLLADREAREKGADQSMMLNEKRCFSECAWANVFFVAYGGLQTPSLDCGVLPGITRGAVIDLAFDLGIAISERWINAEEVWDAEEVFVTSSVIGLLPVTSINGRKIRGGGPGKITRSLALAYDALVRREMGLD